MPCGSDPGRILPPPEPPPGPTLAQSDPTLSGAPHRRRPRGRSGSHRSPPTPTHSFPAESRWCSAISFAATRRSATRPLRTDLRDNLDALSDQVQDLLQLFFPSESIPRDRLQGLLLTALQSSNDEYGAEEALEWAEDFQFPADIGSRDGSALRDHGFDLAAVAADRQAALSESGRLSPDRVRALVPTDDPDYDSLLSFATNGVPIITDPTFIPNGAPPPLRSKYIKMAPVVNKLMLDLFHSGLILIIPTELALQVEGIHFSSTHWALKRGKVWGRPIGDASCTAGNGHSLNSSWVKDHIDSLWGTIQHPTVQRLTSMVISHASRVGWDQLILWKMDLRGGALLSCLLLLLLCVGLHLRLRTISLCFTLRVCLVGLGCRERLMWSLE